MNYRGGQTVLGHAIGVGAASIAAFGLWNAWLSEIVFGQQSNISSLTTSVEDIKANTAELPSLKSEIDWLAQQRGYKGSSLASPQAKNNVQTSAQE